MNIAILLFTALLIVVAYQWVKLQLNRAVQSDRLELARRGEELLFNNDLSELHRRQIKFMMDTAFSSLAPWVGVIIVPIVGLGFLVSTSARDRARQEWFISDPFLRRELESVYDFYTAANWAASPLAMSLISLEKLFFSLMFLVFHAFPPNEMSLVTSEAMQKDAEFVRAFSHKQRAST